MYTEGVSKPMATRKSYHAARNEKIDEIFEFDIDGEVFLAKPHRVPGSTMIDFQGLTVTRDPDAMWDFFRAAMNYEPVPAKDSPKYKAQLDPKSPGYDESLTPFGKFKAFIDDPIRQVDIEMLAEIIKDMVEATTGNPTGQSSS